MSAPVTAEGDTPPAVMPQRQRLVISSARWKEPAARISVARWPPALQTEPSRSHPW